MSFGVYFGAEGLGADWPLGDAAVVYLAAALVGAALGLSSLLARRTAGRSA